MIFEPTPKSMRRICDGSNKQIRQPAHRASLKETTMFRKLALAFVAAASLGALALTPSASSAHGWGFHGGHHHFHGGFHGPAFRVGYIGGAPGCYITRRVMTPWGFRWRTVNVCY
jgi:hypothetical protein